MFFFLMAAFTISYSITDQGMTDLCLKIFKLGFGGDLAEDLFFKGSPSLVDDAFFPRFVLYASFGIIVMVALNNIFIAIMSGAYEDNENRRSPLFVQRRATMALDYALLKNW